MFMHELVEVRMYTHYSFLLPVNDKNCFFIVIVSSFIVKVPVCLPSSLVLIPL